MIEATIPTKKTQADKMFETKLKKLSEVYEMSYDDLHSRAENYVNERARSRKVRVIKDGTISVPSMRAK